jgi:hypothetical protein
MTKLEEAQQLVMDAMSKEREEGGRYSHDYIALRTTLGELEDVYGLHELSEESKHNLQALGFSITEALDTLKEELR